MALEARELRIGQEFPKEGTIIEFPRIFTDEEKQQINEENLVFFKSLLDNQDLETIETAENIMTKNPTVRLEEYFFKPTQKIEGGTTSLLPETDIFGKPVFRHPQTRNDL
jgi:hypothetical protein